MSFAAALCLPRPIVIDQRADIYSSWRLNSPTDNWEKNPEKMSSTNEAYPKYYTDRRGRKLYFPQAVPHWPPPGMTDRKEIAAWAEEAYRKNPALPHVKNATNEMRSPYYFWWAFLRLSAEYAKAVEKGGEGCEVVYSAFGDVFRSPFRDWWENKGSRLFCYRLEQIVRVHDATAQSHTVLVNTDGQLVVSFPINGPLNRIWAEIKVLVEDKRAALGPLPSLDADTPLFKLLTSSSVRSHFCRLTTYEMISGGASRSQVAHYLQITQGAEEKDYLRQVDRWHAEAESIVRHVAAGHFPVLNDDPPSPPKAGGVALRRTKKL